MKLTSYLLVAVTALVMGVAGGGYLVYTRMSAQYAQGSALGHINDMVMLINRAVLFEQQDKLPERAHALVQGVDSGLCMMAHTANRYRRQGLQVRSADYLFDLIEKRRQQLLARETPETFAGYRYLADCDMQAEHSPDEIAAMTDRI